MIEQKNIICFLSLFFAGCMSATQMNLEKTKENPYSAESTKVKPGIHCDLSNLKTIGLVVEHHYYRAGQESEMGYKIPIEERFKKILENLGYEVVGVNHSILNHVDITLNLNVKYIALGANYYCESGHHNGWFWTGIEILINASIVNRDRTLFKESKWSIRSEPSSTIHHYGKVYDTDHIALHSLWSHSEQIMTSDFKDKNSILYGLCYIISEIIGNIDTTILFDKEVDNNILPPPAEPAEPAAE